MGQSICFESRHDDYLYDDNFGKYRNNSNKNIVIKFKVEDIAYFQKKKKRSKSKLR